MFSKEQLKQAKEFTGRFDIEDKYINEEFNNLKPEEKEKATIDLWEVFTTKSDLPIIDILDISSKYFISEPVLFCLFKEYQTKLRKEGKID